MSLIGCDDVEEIFVLMQIIKRFCLPAMLLALSVSSFAGPIFQAERLSVDGGQMSYYRLGSGSKTILLLHGLFAKKSQWQHFVEAMMRASPNLLKRYQLIIPDLAGYAESQGYPFSVYNLDSNRAKVLSNVKVLHDFLDKLHCDRDLNIAGNSMGGLLMVLYQQHYPHRVSSMAFMGSPEGIANFTPRYFEEGIRQGFNPFIPTTVKAFKVGLSLLLYDDRAIMPSDKTIRQWILPKNIKDYQRKTNIYNAVNIPRYLYALQKPQSFKGPVLIEWGAEDHIFGSPRHAKSLANHFHRACIRKIDIIPRAGHLILLESLQVEDLIAKHYLAFLKRSG